MSNVAHATERRQLERVATARPEASGARAEATQARTAGEAVVATPEALELDRRRQLGGYTIGMVGLLCAYSFLLTGMGRAFQNGELITRLVEISGVCAIGYAILRSGLPLRDIGFTLEGWRPAVRDALLMFGLLALVGVGVRLYFEPYTDVLIGQPVITPYVSRWWIVPAYMLIAPFQEVLRGALQVHLTRLIVSQRASMWGAVAAGTVFGTVHLHYSLTNGFIAMTLGVCMGWLYARRRTLVATGLCHLLIGLFGLFILGGERWVLLLP
ncbi:MAG: CPBP family intramembrane glutamic endopeptidase [Planctomycetota bacterium]|jgi:membrane protease YdiL (CAAX protease family)